jgi:type I restriction enzyme R subunit
VLGEEHFEKIDPDEHKQLIEEAKIIDSIVTNAVEEHSLSPQSIESSIKTGLLPRLFNLMGFEKAKDVIEHVIQITRVRLAHGHK